MKCRTVPVWVCVRPCYCVHIYVCLPQMERGSECLHVCVSVSITNWVRKRIESTVTLTNINGDWNGQEKSMQIWYVVRVWCVSVCLLCSCVFVPFAIEYVHMHIFMHTYTRTWHTRCSRILWLLYFLFCSYFFPLLFFIFFFIISCISLAPQCSFHSHNRIAKHCEFSPRYDTFSLRNAWVLSSLTECECAYTYTHSNSHLHSHSLTHTHTATTQKKIQMAIIGYCQF